MTGPEAIGAYALIGAGTAAVRMIAMHRERWGFKETARHAVACAALWPLVIFLTLLDWLG